MNVAERIESKLRDGLTVRQLEVVNESHMHSVPPNSETHFKVVAVSADFDGLPKVRRHQRIYALLADELAGPVHALALHTYTPAEWEQREQTAPASPDCHGGSKADSAP